jgi:hypothetical protein
MQSTEIAPKGDAPYTQWCVVYDRRTGAVVHIHQHIAVSSKDALSAGQLTSQAMEQASKERGNEFFDVAHPADDTPLEVNTRYRVELESGRIRCDKQWRFKPQRAGKRGDLVL